MAEIPEQKIKALEKKVGSGGKSPRFAQLAGFYLHQGKAKEALRLCDEGLATFPHYSTGHFIKGKALLALKMNAEARREFEIVADFLPANETVSFILSNIQPGEGETLVSPREPAMVRPSTTQVAPAEAAAETAPPSEPETVPAAQETAVPAQPTNIFEAVGQTPEAVEDPFGFGTAGADQAAPPAKDFRGCKRRKEALPRRKLRRQAFLTFHSRRKNLLLLRREKNHLKRMQNEFGASSAGT